ncbi:Pol polyprotein [Elysia marginata]|uniref:Pol polyprotein n=1 Tax=Elysia marginata TaxID=1093978 RepID=A0AAV4F882_9GAST|nr:Pol polyprotein [Elysia marginata]
MTVVSALDVKTAEEVQDVLVKLPDADRYGTLKKTLIKAFGKSQAQLDNRRAQQPTSTLTAANGTSIHIWGRRSVSLAIGRRRQHKHEFYLADVTRPILGADFFTKHGLAIDLRGKRLLSVDNNPILPRETRSPLNLAGSGSTLQNKFSSLLQQFYELLAPHFNHSTNKHGVEHHIVTHGPPTHARARRLDPEKLSAAKTEFLQMEEMGIVRRSKSAWSSHIRIVPNADGKWQPCGDCRRLNA